MITVTKKPRNSKEQLNIVKTIIDCLFKFKFLFIFHIPSVQNDSASLEKEHICTFLTSDIFCLIFTLSCISFLRQVSLSPINCNKKRSINPNRKTLLLAKWENTKENFACIIFAFKLELCWVELYCLSDSCYTRFNELHINFKMKKWRVFKMKFIKWHCQPTKIIYS